MTGSTPFRSATGRACRGYRLYPSVALLLPTQKPIGTGKMLAVPCRRVPARRGPPALRTLHLGTRRAEHAATSPVAHRGSRAKSRTLLATHQQYVRVHPGEAFEGRVHLLDQLPVETLCGDECFHGDIGRFDPPLLPPEVQRGEWHEQPSRQKGAGTRLSALTKVTSAEAGLPPATSRSNLGIHDVEMEPCRESGGSYTVTLRTEGSVRAPPAGRRAYWNCAAHTKCAAVPVRRARTCA